MKKSITILLSVCASILLVPDYSYSVRRAALDSESAYEKEWVITATDYNSTPYYGAIVGNGGIGILPWREPFSVKQVMLNHVFDTSSKNDVSSVLLGLNPFNLSMKIDGVDVSGTGVKNWHQSVDMHKAVHITQFEFLDKAEISCEVRALRNMPYAGLMTIKIRALRNIKINVTDSVSIPDRYGAVLTAAPVYDEDGRGVKIVRRSAPGRYRGIDVSASATFVFDGKEPKSLSNSDEKLGFDINLKSGEEYQFSLAGSVCTGRDFLDPFNESDRQLTYIANEGVDRMLARHEKMWEELWQGDVIIEGDEQAQRAIRFSLYNLYSSARSGSGLSIPPFGLSSAGYNGHIFWDTELWMYPPMLYLNQGIAQSMMDYRTNRVESARRRARTYGYEGAMFPWESDDAGEESCPVWALTGAFEHHITADVAIAAWNYYLMSKDKKWLKEKGWPLISSVAEFWVSRVDRNEDGSYSVNNVVGADEYAIGVNDNAFTNGAVIAAMRAAVGAGEVCGEPVPEVWRAIAEGLRLPVSPDGVTLEYEGYEGVGIKQADVNLLGYPLGVIKDEERLRKDLEYYENKIDPKGPAMSFAVFAIQHARLGDGDKGYELFVRSYKHNQLPPFGVVSEGAGGTNPYFMTGAGGFLQAVINGFCGLELTEEGVVQLPSALPSHWKSVTVTGVGPERKSYTRRNK